MKVETAEILVEHKQFLNKHQNDYTDEIQWAFKAKRKTWISKTKVLQMILDHCIKLGIKPEEFIK